MVRKLHFNKNVFSKRHKSIPSLVQSGFCNEVPRTWWLVSNRNLFLTVLGAHQECRAGAPAGPELVAAGLGC